MYAFVCLYLTYARWTHSARTSYDHLYILYAGEECCTNVCFVRLVLSYLQPMSINVLCYQSHLLQRCHPFCGHEGLSYLSPVFALSAKEARVKIMILSRIELATSALKSTRLLPLHSGACVYTAVITLSRLGMNQIWLPQSPCSWSAEQSCF